MGYAPFESERRNAARKGPSNQQPALHTSPETCTARSWISGILKFGTFFFQNLYLSFRHYSLNTELWQRMDTLTQEKHTTSKLPWPKWHIKINWSSKNEWARLMFSCHLNHFTPAGLWHRNINIAGVVCDSSAAVHCLNYAETSFQGNEYVSAGWLML